MATPEQSRPPRTGPEPDAIARSVPEQPRDHIGPEPEENQPGHHPEVEQDQPPLDDFAAKFGIPPEAPSEEEGASSRPRPHPADREVEPSDGEGAERRGSEPDQRPHRPSVARPMRAVWVVTARRGVLPALGGVRWATVTLERIVRRTI